MNEKIILGIDTSNYTTSLSLITTDGKLLANIKEPLPVKAGERGLRQSDAVFAHVKNLPLVMKRARDIIGEREVVAVGASERPRNVDGSYMPCFLCGISARDSIVAATGASTTTISRVNRCLNYGDGGYKKVIEKCK